LNYSGIEKVKSKYCLIGCDPINDSIIFDLASLKNANSRQLIYDKLGVDLNKRSKYLLEVKDYIISDSDRLNLGSIFDQWAIKLKDMNFLLQSKHEFDTYFQKNTDPK
jgi:hypothetical protein